MPKELIYGTSVPFEQSDAEVIVPVVEVRWDGESGFFQIGTRERNHEIPPLEVQEQDGPWPCTYGYPVELDRRGINNLIRSLRRARDQAFGKDE
jgi:hypothetical protein